ncbi:hypothetical protein [Lysobacter tyrosinilyticus]
MFRYLTVLFLAIWAIDRTAFMLFTGRAAGPIGAITKRKLNPLGYWTVSGLWCACAVVCLGGLAFLTYCALTGSGPYKEHAFFSMHQAWPLLLFLVPGGWLAFLAVRDWITWIRFKRPRDAA